MSMEWEIRAKKRNREADETGQCLLYPLAWEPVPEAASCITALPLHLTNRRVPVWVSCCPQLTVWGESFASFLHDSSGSKRYRIVLCLVKCLACKLSLKELYCAPVWSSQVVLKRLKVKDCVPRLSDRFPLYVLPPYPCCLTDFPVRQKILNLHQTQASLSNN